LAPARLVFGSLGGLLIALTFACGPTAAPTSTAVTADPFAIVRATSQAAYQTGKAHLDRGEFIPACIDLDRAKTTDPDSRPEVQQALEAALRHCLTPGVEPTSAPRTTVVGATAQLVATIRVVASLATVTPGLPAVATPAVIAPKPFAATPQTDPTAPAAVLVAWRDPQGRFSVGAPVEWVTEPQPHALFGTSVVQFRDPSGRAEFDVAVDGVTRAVSPELYAASMDISMQKQVPGYAGEQVFPGSTAGLPSVRRVFTFTARDAAGHDLQARSFQVTVLKGSTPYIISGSAPAEQFQQYSPTFDQMVESFRFS
jgi:hypothetical protein